MTCISISSDELKERVAAANRAAEEIGMLLEGNTLGALVASGEVQLVYDPKVSSGEFAGLEFFEKTKEWASRRHPAAHGGLRKARAAHVWRGLL